MTDSLPHTLLSASSAIVADALDALGLRDQVLNTRIKGVFAGARMVGRAYPVSVVTDSAMPSHPYAGEMQALSAMSAGDVGVYGVQGQTLAAAWGELFSCAAIGRGVAGVLVDGCIRDTQQIGQLNFPVFASGTSPLDTLARARVDSHGISVLCGDMHVVRGDVIVADGDGVVVIPSGKVAEVAAFIAHKHRLEQAAKDDLLAGMAIEEVWEKYGVF